MTEAESSDEAALTWETFCAEVRAVFNEVCLIHTSELGRVVGASQDACDYYYIAKDALGRIAYHSAVGHCDSLRGLPSYDAIASRFDINGGTAEAEFIVDSRPDDDSLYRAYAADPT